MLSSWGLCEEQDDRRTFRRKDDLATRHGWHLRRRGGVAACLRYLHHPADDAGEHSRGPGLFGLFAPAGFFVTLSVLIEPLGIGLGFAVATAAALVAQGLALLMLRPGTLSG